MSPLPQSQSWKLFLLVLVVLAESIPAVRSAAGTTPSIQQITPPLLFERNLGQLDARVRFVARALDGSAYFFTENGFTLLQWRDDPAGAGRMAELGPGPSSPDGEQLPAIPRGAGHVLRVRYPGANARPSIDARGLTVTKSSYFIGNDSSRWRTEIPNYSSIAYQNIYPGIDLVFRSHGQRLEYDFLVHPGADAGNIRIVYDGASGEIAVADDGGVVVPTTLGAIHEMGPRVYQVDAAPCGQSTIDGVPMEPASMIPAAWTVEHNMLAFDLGHHDAKGDLLIDPILYSTFLGGSTGATRGKVKKDANGYLYCYGRTFATDFPPTIGAYDPTHNGDGDGHVFKMNPAGTQILYGTYYGGISHEEHSDLGFAPDGGVIVSGTTFSSDLPITPGAPMPTFGSGGTDGYVLKLNASGSALDYSTYLGSPAIDNAGALNVDAAGAAIVLVSSSSLAGVWPTTPGVLGPVPHGGSEVIVLKLSPDGLSFEFLTYLGGTGSDGPRRAFLDADGGLWISGLTGSTDFPTSPGCYSSTPVGGNDFFICKINSTATAVLKGTLLGGSGSENVAVLSQRSDGALVVMGYTASANYPTTPNAYDASFGGVADVCMSVMSNDLTTLLASTLIGGAGQDEGYNLCLMPDGSMVVLGTTRSLDFPTTPDALYGEYRGGQDDDVLIRLDAACTQLLFSSFLGGSGRDLEGAVLNEGMDVLMVGFTSSPDFPVTPDAYDSTYNSMGDMFLMRFQFDAGGDASLSGIVFEDEDGNGDRGPVEPGVPGRFVQLTPGPSYAITRDDGTFLFANLIGNDYTLRLLPREGTTQTAPADSDSIVVHLPQHGSIDNLALGEHEEDEESDLCIALGADYHHPLGTAPDYTPCCGEMFDYLIYYGNAKNGSPVAKIELQLPPECVYSGPTTSIPDIGQPTVSGGPLKFLTWNGVSVPFSSGRLIKVPVLVECPGGVVDIECSNISGRPNMVGHASIDVTQGSESGKCPNVAHLPTKLSCACDPNDLHVWPHGCDPGGRIVEGDSLTYQVQFQNVGDRLARRVVIRDTLDSDIDMNTLVEHGASHPYLLEVHGHELVWSFWDINLPPASLDDFGSQGFVKFSVSPVASLPVGTEIDNRAGIYFDYNAPILTNSTLNTITDDPMPIAAFAASQTSIEVGETVDFTYTGGYTGGTYFWNLGPYAVPATSTEENPAGVTYMTGGAKNVTLWVKGGGCESEPAYGSVLSLSVASVPDERVGVAAFTSVHPNPAMGPVSIEYTLPGDQLVRLSVFDVMGREVAIIASGVKRKGTHRVEWNRRLEHNVKAVGIYFVRLKVASTTLSRRLVIMP